MTRQQYERIRLQGLSARQGGSKADANPYAGKASLRRQADAWLAGWAEAHAKMGARR